MDPPAASYEYLKQIIPSLEGRVKKNIIITPT